MSGKKFDEVDLIMAQWQQLGLHTDLDAIKIIGRVLRLAKTIEQQVGELHREFALKPGEFDDTFRALPKYVAHLRCDDKSS